MSFTESYSIAMRAKDLRSEADTTRSATDLLGAAGLAAKRLPLAMLLERYFCGDDGAAHSLVREMAELAWGKAQAEHVMLKRVQADEMARKVLAWFAHGTCSACGGHGYELIAGTPSLSENACKACHGSKRKPFRREFALERLLIAEWLLAEVEREQAKAGPAAMAKLAPRLDL